MWKTVMLAAIWAIIALFICLAINVDLIIIIKYAVIGFIVGYIWEGPVQHMLEKAETSLEKLKVNKEQKNNKAS